MRAAKRAVGSAHQGLVLQLSTALAETFYTMAHTVRGEAFMDWKDTPPHVKAAWEENAIRTLRALSANPTPSHVYRQADVLARSFERVAGYIGPDCPHGLNRNQMAEGN